MAPLRRSQRPCVRSYSGQPNGRSLPSMQKRKHVGEKVPRDMKPKIHRLAEKNLTKYQMQEKAKHRTRRPSANSSKMSTATTTTDRQFGPTLIQNGVVFDTSFTCAPNDFAEVKLAITREQDTPESAHENWLGMREAKRQMALGELSLESEVIESMLLQHRRPVFYRRFRNDQWTEIENEISVGISDLKPGVTESYLWSVYPPRTREDFVELVPTQYGYAMPTFAMESKGSGDPEQAVKQAAYDGAVMTHAALATERQMKKNEESLYSKTKAITVTLSSTDICVYANHAIKGPGDGKIAYHHHRVIKLPYLDSELDWNMAHSVLYNAQAFALSLANSRLQDLKKHYEKEDVRFERMKAKQGKLQAEARAKVRASMPSPSSKHVSAAKTSKSFPRSGAGPSMPTSESSGEISKQETSKVVKASHG